MIAVNLQAMKDAMEVLNEKLRQAVYNSHVLSSKLSADRETISDLEQQLLDQHYFVEKRQHDYVLMEHELQVMLASGSALQLSVIVDVTNFSVVWSKLMSDVRRRPKRD